MRLIERAALAVFLRFIARIIGILTVCLRSCARCGPLTVLVARCGALTACSRFIARRCPIANSMQTVRVRGPWGVITSVEICHNIVWSIVVAALPQKSVIVNKTID